MASDNEASCESDPNFAVICAFMEKFGTTCGLQSIDFLELQEMLENTQEVRQELIDLHIKLLRKSRKTVSNERWERAVIKFCHTFCVQDAWEIERFGYKKARLSSKLRVLKELLEMQFDYNARFKAEINKMSAEELRSQPLGKDKHGHAYWFQNDNNCQIRVYKEDPDEETWTLVAKDREGLASLITELSDGDSKISTESAINEEDSNSLAEKPIIDTGQVDSSSSDSNHKSENSNESKKEDNISEEDDEEEQSTNKRSRESDEDNNEDVKRAKNSEENHVGETVEEPVMLVKGEGSGEENKCVNPIIGEEIEEDLMFFYGDGNGVDSETGNEDKTSDSQTNNQSENSDATTDTSDTSKISISDSKNYVKNVPTSPVKTQYKLGTIIDTKTDNKFFSSTVKSPTKTSRWDVETIISKDSSDTTGRVKDLVNKFEQINDDENDKETPKKSMFFFGPGCLQFTPATVGFGQKVPPENTDDTASHENKKNEDKGDVGYRIGDNKVEYNDCVQSGNVDAGPLGNETPVETRIEEKLDNAAIEETKVEENDKHDKKEEEIEKIKEIEEQIIKEEEQEQTGPIPQVTAALIESEELKTSPENSEPQSVPKNEEESVPAVEETCVKKDAYVCGQEETEELTINTDENKNEHSLVELKEEEEEKLDDIESKDTENVSTKTEENETATNIETKVNEKVEENEEHDTKEITETKKEKNGDSNQEETLKTEDNKAPEKIMKEAVVYIKDEDKKKVEEKKEETVNNSAAVAVTKRGRKNNSNEQSNEEEKKPKVATRRTTRSTKNEEPVEEIGATRKGRTRAQKSEKEETTVDDSNKKMKMSTEEENTMKKTKRGKPSSVEEKETTSEKEESETVACPQVIVESSSSDVVELVEKDPLAVSEEEIKTKPMSLANFSLDFNESPAPTPPLTRSGLRKRGRESPQNVEDVEETGGKRLKMKPKRAVDVKLRKSIEEQKKIELVSSDDDSSTRKKSDETILVSSDIEKEAEPTKKKKKKSTVNKNKRLLSNLGIDPEKAFDFDSAQTSGVRQSRRIAQLKIKEEAERRKFEEEAVVEQRKKKKSKKSEDKDYKADKKKPKNDEEEEAEEDSGDSKKKRKKKKKKKDRLMFDEYNPWKSSSGSSSSDEEVEEEEEIGEEDDDEVLQYVSDHEFSPESDMEGDAEPQPLKRARTARKESDIEEVDDCPCQKCGKSDHPEWILLCDSCDNGWHCSCLRPPLLVIPEGDWFCPPCQHTSLLKNLNEKLQEFDKKLNKKEIEDRRKQRLAYVGISLNNVLPTKETDSVKKRKHKRPEENDDDDDEDDEYGNDDEDGDEGDEEESSDEESDSGSGSASETDSDEPIYQLRQRRQAHSYRFNDYDELINSAIQDEMEAVKGAGNQGRGKDISTIVNAEKEEEKKKEAEEKEVQEPLPPVVPLNDKDKEPKPLFDDDDGVQVKKKIIGRKKHRKLNSLDISDEDDEDSDEDFKGTTTDSDDDFDEDLGSDDSDDLDTGRRRRGGDPVRRSTRARTSRYDADFIDDGSSDSEDDAPRRKKKRSIWDDSESEESDKSWGRRKRKTGGGNRSRRTTVTTTKKKKSKKKKKHNDSDEEVYKKKKPKIKFGLDGDDDGPVRRTRGKKINYIDALGSDSDDDRGKRPPPRIESDEEYVANEDDVPEDEKISEEETDYTKQNKVQIQSYTDAKFTKILPEPKNQFPLDEVESELNPIDQINRNVEMMDENEMEKMMEDEEYANKHLQMVAQQLEKEKRRKEREAKKLEMGEQQQHLKKVVSDPKDQFQFSGSMQEPLVGNVDNLIVNSENNDELSEPPGVSLPLFAELGDGLDDQLKKRRGKTKKSLEETVATLGTARQQEVVPYAPHPTDLSGGNNNLEIAAPPQPFSQSQPTPSVITRMLQNKPGQPGYPVGTIRPKQFATMPERDEEVHHPITTHGQYNTIQGGGLRSFPPMSNYPRPQIPKPMPPVYHSHRAMDPSPSGGGAINMADHNSPGRVVSPASSSPGSNKNETPPPPYSRPPPTGRFSTGPRHVVPQQMVAPPPPPLRPNLSPYHPNLPPAYHYSQYGGQEDALPPTVYQSSPYTEQFDNSQVTTPENSNNSKTFDEESGGEFGGLVSYFSSQREDDLES